MFDRYAWLAWRNDGHHGTTFQLVQFGWPNAIIFFCYAFLVMLDVQSANIFLENALQS